MQQRRDNHEAQIELATNHRFDQRADKVHVQRRSGFAQNQHRQRTGEVPDGVHDAGETGQNRAEYRRDRHVREVESPEDHAAGRTQRGTDRDIQRLPFQ